MKAYIIHVSDAYEREAHMQEQLKGKNLDVSYILEGDKKDLSESVIKKYFKGEMAAISSATSCSYKHLLAYERIAEGDEEIVMILEDDIRFYSNYHKLVDILNEINSKKIKNFMLSLEDSNLKYVAKSERIKGSIVYPKKKGRLAGAYLIDKEGARNMLQFAKNEKLSLPIDWFHNACVANDVIKMYWSRYAIAVQGSLDGSIKSLLDDKKSGTFRVWSFRLQRIYKKLLYQMR